MSRTHLIVSAILIVILGLITVPAGWAGGLKPAANVYTTGASPQAVAVGDVNGDGNLDIVVANNSGSPGTIDIYYGNGNGTFGNRQTINVGNGPVAVAVGNLAQSHTVALMNDIAVANSTDNSVTVLLNTSANSTTPQTFSTTTLTKVAGFVGTSPVALVIAEFNNAAGLDIAVVNQADNTVSVITNNNNNTFASHSAIGGFGTPVPTAIVAGQFGGGNPGADFAVGTSTGKSVILFFNTGATFTPQTPISVTSAVVAMAAGTINTGNDIAVATAPSGGNTVHVLLSSASYADAPYAVGTTAPTGIAIADFSADGLNDVAVSNSDANGGVTLAFNVGGGVLSPLTATDYPAGLNGVAAAGLAIAAGDFNGDGRLDVAVPNSATPGVAPLLSTPYFDFVPQVISPLYEGVTFNSQPILKFQYDGNTNDETVFNNASTQVTNYGDANSGTATVQPPVAGVFTLLADSHKYSDPGAEGSKTITIAIHNSLTSQDITTTSPQSVADAPLHPCGPTNAVCTTATADLPTAAAPPPNITETNVVVATFTDDNTTALATDFTATIDFGNCNAGAPGVCSGGNLVTGAVTGPVAGVFTVKGTSAPYKAGGLFTIHTTINDTEASVSPQSTSVTIHLSLTNMTAGAAQSVNVVEGNTLANGTTIAELSPGANVNPTGFTATVDWGDSTGIDSHTQVVGPKGGPFQVQTLGSTHAYTNEGSFSATIVITDPSDGSTLTITTPVTVTEGTIAVTVNALSPVEGAVSGAVGSFTDQDKLTTPSNYTVQVDWGQGGGFVAATNVTGSNGSFTVGDTHTYPEEGSFTVKIKVTDNKSPTNIVTNSNTATVGDAPLTAPTNAPISIGSVATPLVVGISNYSGPLGSFSDGNASAPLIDFDNPSGGGALNTGGSFVDWGDGLANRENCTSNAVATPHCVISGSAPNFTVAGSHTFQAAGTLAVVVHIHDVGGSNATINNITAHVSSLSTPVTKQVPGAVEGVQFASSALLDFTSHRGGAVAADFAVVGTTVDWGDGKPVDNGAGANLTVTGGGGSFTLSGVHTYNEETPSPAICGNLAACQLTITIKDNIDGSTLTVGPAAFPTGSTVAVGDAPVTGVAVGAIAGSFVEGASTGTQIVGAFTDGNPGAPLTDFPSANIIIHWGDGQQSNGTAIANGTGACAVQFCVTGSHTYAEGGLDAPGGGLYSITIDVKDIGGSQFAGFASSTIQVNDAPLSNIVVSAIAGGGTGPGGKLVANVDTFSGNVATFHDANLNAPTTDFSGTIDWGDGTAPTAFTSANVTATPVGSGNFTIASSHMFVKAGTQLTPVTVKVNDVGGSSTGPTAGSAAVVTSLINPTSININPTEGTSFSGAVGTFQATSGGASFTVTITWGDGNVNAATSVTGPGPVWTVNGTNTYTEHTPTTGYCASAPACAISIHVVDGTDGSTLDITGGGATVADAPVTGVAVGAIAGSFVEGASTGTQIVGAFTDGNLGAPLTDFPSANIIIHWGDGQQSNGTAIANGTGACAVQFCVTGSHTYAEGGLDAPNGGLYTITIDVKDIGGSQFAGFASSTIQVNDAPLTLLAGGINTLTGGTGQGGKLVANFDTFNGVVATFTDANTAAPTSDFSGTVDFGDGAGPIPFTSANVGGGGGTYTITLSHMFLKAGTQLTPVTVTVNDVGGSTTGAVAGPKANVTSLHLPVATNITPVEGVLFSGGVGGFTATTGNANFSATINWGDGNISNATSFTGGPAWTVNGSNMYTDEDPITCGAGCAISIALTDNTDGSTLTISGGKANVADAPLSPMPVPGIIIGSGQALNGVLVAQFQDGNSLAPVADFTSVTVHWNDTNNPGATSTLIGGTGGGGQATITKLPTPVGAPTRFQITASYTGYAINGNYGITFDVVDKGGSTISGGAGATVSNAPGVLTGAGKTLTVLSGLLTGQTIATFKNTNPALPATDYTGTVNWGDGKVDSCSGTQASTPACYYVSSGSGTFNVIGTHTYLNALGQTFPISLVVNDTIGGASVNISSTANIPNVVLTGFLGGTSPPQSQIQAGQAVDVLLTLSPNPGVLLPFTTPVVFTGCTILSGPATSGLTCSITPSQVPDVTQVRQVHVLVQSFTAVAMQNAPPRPGSNRPIQLALLLPAFVGTFGVVLLGSRKNKRHTILWWGASFLLLALLLAGCGGGGLATPTAGGTATVPGTYILQINTDAGTAVGQAPCPATALGTGPCLTAQVTITK